VKKNSVSQYEIVLLLSPEFSESEAREHVEKYKREKLGDIQGSVEFEDFWGKRTLAYPIKKETSAWYFVLVFSANGGRIASLDEESRLDTKIIRHLIVRTDGVEFQTLEEIEEWNRENLPKKKKSEKPQEKRASFQGRETSSSNSRRKYSKISTPSDKSTNAKKENINKEQLDKKLDEILDKDISV
jgi:small subunit ribosomal protein S6